MTKLWGGRFSKKTDPLVEKFSKSIQYDHKLAECDLLGSIVHVAVLKAEGYLTPKEYTKLSKVLFDLYNKAHAGKFNWDPTSEDIHTNIHNEVKKKVGNLASKLHTARSRNDQVAILDLLQVGQKWPEHLDREFHEVTPNHGLVEEREARLQRVGIAEQALEVRVVAFAVPAVRPLGSRRAHGQFRAAAFFEGGLAKRERAPGEQEQRLGHAEPVQIDEPGQYLSRRFDRLEPVFSLLTPHF